MREENRDPGRRSMIRGLVGGGTVAALAGSAALLPQPARADSAAAPGGDPFALPRFEPNGRVREFWIQAESFEHNAVPNGTDAMMGRPFTAEQTTFWALGYRAYSPDWESPLEADLGPDGIGANSGIPGPVLRAEAGDVIRVHFRNNDEHYRWPHSMHPHGVVYDRDNDGGWLAEDPQRAGTAVAYGESYTYTWFCHPSSVGTWPYHDHSLPQTPPAAPDRGPTAPTGDAPGDPGSGHGRAPGSDAAGATRHPGGHDGHGGDPAGGQHPGQGGEGQQPGHGAGDAAADGPATGSGGGNGNGGDQQPGHGGGGQDDSAVGAQDAGHGSMVMEIGAELGLFGVLVVTDQQTPPVDREFVLFLHDLNPRTARSLGQSLNMFNGRAFVDNTPTCTARVGERVRWRIACLGEEFHVFHIHGHRWRSRQGYQGWVDSQIIGPSTTLTIEYTEDNPGDWIYHCHVTHHMTGGMVGRYRVTP